MAQAKSNAIPGAKDAISILTEDHKKVKKMFADFDKLMTSGDKEEEKGAACGPFDQCAAIRGFTGGLADFAYGGLQPVEHAVLAGA